MMNVFKYKMAALALAGVFAVFNIGLPIVLYACPMMQQSSLTAACCVDQSGQSGASIRISVDRSCCKPVYAAGRNTTEFLQSKDKSSALDYSTTSPVDYVVTIPSAFLATSAYYSASPPIVTDDIPILTSSLLI